MKTAKLSQDEINIAAKTAAVFRDNAILETRVARIYVRRGSSLAHGAIVCANEAWRNARYFAAMAKTGTVTT